jgi:hypothetical protein
LYRSVFFALAISRSLAADSLKSGFEAPPKESRPETWFHLISGNANKTGLTSDLEAATGAGLQGIQLFYGAGRAWPDVAPQVQTLSPDWDSMISHVADETKRLGLSFTMQNCPGWAMSCGMWITPDNEMRHIIWSRTDSSSKTSRIVTSPLASTRSSFIPIRTQNRSKIHQHLAQSSRLRCVLT